MVLWIDQHNFSGGDRPNQVREIVGCQYSRDGRAEVEFVWQPRTFMSCGYQSEFVYSVHNHRPVGDGRTDRRNGVYSRIKSRRMKEGNAHLVDSNGADVRCIDVGLALEKVNYPDDIGCLNPNNASAYQDSGVARIRCSLAVRNSVSCFADSSNVGRSHYVSLPNEFFNLTAMICCVDFSFGIEINHRRMLVYSLMWCEQEDWHRGIALAHQCVFGYWIAGALVSAGKKERFVGSWRSDKAGELFCFGYPLRKVVIKIFS